MEPEQLPWRRNMWILWAAVFVMYSGFSLIVPFLPLYVQSMGSQVSNVELWTGLIFSANYISAAIALPFWGGAADRSGRRPMMIRAAFGMGIVVSLMGFATSPVQLAFLRLIQGVFVGFFAAAVAYMTQITPAGDTGYMLAIMQTAVTAGNILGPFMGGILASFMGYRAIFWATGGACIISGIIVLALIQERFTPAAGSHRSSVLADMGQVARNRTLLAMMIVILIQNLSVMTAEPIISLYLRTMNVTPALLSFLSGAVFSVVGIANVIVSPYLGRAGDRVGYKKVLLISLGGVAVAYALQAIAFAWWQLLIYRFVQGCFVGGVLAAANSLISHAAPANFKGRAFAIATSAQMAGSFLGPLVGGAVAAGMGYRPVFPVTGVLCALNLLYVWWSAPNSSPVRAPEKNPAAS